MDINELQMKKVRLSNQLSDLDREKVELQTALTEVKAEIEYFTGPNSEQQIWDQRNKYDTKDFTLERISGELQLNNIIYGSAFSSSWDSVKKSRFIESLILGLPIPILLMADSTVKEQLSIIDGNQRVLTADDFITNHLQLKGLTVLESLNDLYFKDLILSRQRKFLNTSIRTIIFSNPTEEVKMDLANRFNR